MSIYKSSSLAMLPTAYKDGKLYSVRPTDGSGDFTFSRGSNLAATRVDVNGLIEKGRENLLLQSNQFDTTWVNSNSTETDGQSGYDGSSDAWQLTASSAGNAYLQQSNTKTGVQTFSVYAKAGTADHLQVYITGTDSSHYFDLTNGTAPIPTGAGAINSSIEAISGGWYRCSCVCNGNNATLRLYIRQGVNINPSAGEYILIQDAQLEQGLVATDVIETGASTAQAGILEDLPRLDYSGGASCPSLLLEPSRTNQITNSEYIAGWVGANTTIIANSGISPEGVSNATSITFASGGYWYQAISLSYTAGQTFVWSIYANTSTQVIQWGGATPAGTTTYEFIDAGNGWYRQILTRTTSGSGTGQFQTLMDSIYIGVGVEFKVFGAQFEAGSYPTSYIPTYGSSVTRSNDTYINSSIGASLSSGYTAFVEVETLSTTEYNQIQFKDLSTNYILRIGNQVRVLGTSYVASNTSGVNKFALQVESTGDYNLFKNGSSVATGSGVTFDLNEIKNDVSGSKVKQLLVFPTALTDSECIALTTL